jgi:MraZ protein
MAFDGTAEYSLDAKNRLTVPARFRADLAGGLVLAKGIERCVALWKPADYEAFRAAALEGMHPLSQDARKLQLWDRGAWADYNQQLHDDVLSITSSLGHPA